MIKLYCTPNSLEAAVVEEGLKELVLAHQVITVQPGQLPDSLPVDTPLPALLDEGKIITGAEALKAHLQYLKHVAFEWRKYQSDSCYVHKDGGNC
jgi:hypothetical protein